MEPAPGGVRRERRILLKIVIVLIVLLVAGAAYAYFFVPNMPAILEGRIRYLTAFVTGTPDDLTNALYLFAPSSGARLYSEKGTDAAAGAPTISPEDILFDVVREGDDIALLNLDTKAKVKQVIYNGAIVTETPFDLHSLALSPSHAKLLYTEGQLKKPTDPFDPSVDWQIVVREIPGGKELHRYKGVRAFFLDDSTIIRFTSTGVVATNMDTGEEKTYKEGRFDFATILAVQSVDRTLLAFADSVSGHTSVYRVTDAWPLGLEPVITRAVPLGGSQALTANALYSVSYSPNKASEVWRYPHDGTAPTMVHRFSKTIGVRKMVP